MLSCCASRGAAVARPMNVRRPALIAVASKSTTTSSSARLRRADRASCRASGANDQQTTARLYSVHRFFDSLHAPGHDVEDLLTADAHFEDSNQACYRGYRAIKHRLQELHEALPKLKEASEVADAQHGAVAAHWVAQGASSGTLVFSFNADGLIERIAGYTDGAESEFLEA